MIRRVGSREFRNNAARLLASDEVLAVERHGRLVGYFVPVDPPLEDSLDEAITKLRRAEGGGDVLAVLRAKREEIIELCARRGASNVRVFGSVARGEATSRSDVDLLVDFDSGRSLFDQAGLMIDLEAFLDRPVDVVTEGALRSPVRESVLAEAELL